VPALLDVQHLTVQFPMARMRGAQGAECVTAVHDLSFQINAREVLGLVGESGSGKSVTSLALMRLLPPQARVSGEIFLAQDYLARGEDGDGGRPRDLLQLPSESMRELRGRRMAMIFQEPMSALNPVMRVGDQIAEAVLAHENISERVSKKEAWERAVAAMDDTAIPDAARRARDYPHQLSGGMRQRIMIAMALVNRPQLLIADEPTTALDVTVQEQILKLLGELREKFGLTMIFISHDLAVVSQIADRVAVMYTGNLVELGSKQDIFKAPAHPYTRGLLNAVPTLSTARSAPLKTIEGVVPPLHALPAGCHFEPRCEYKIPACSRALPELLEVSRGHWARCPVVNKS
jgi:oligopeptide/dipeptide ABC transporter ATP-binding protein